MQNQHNEHTNPMVTYNLIFVVLAVATIIELLVSEIGGVIGTILLLAVTTVKAALVVAFYMHLKQDRPLYTWLLIVPAIMGVAVIISLQGLAGY